jgi:hypothetical protein
VNGPESCAIVGFGIKSVQALQSTTTELIRSLGEIQKTL